MKNKSIILVYIICAGAFSSCRINPHGDYNDAVDISYTKPDERQIDNNPFNFVEPGKGQLYVGGTQTGEWTRYTINVTKAGTYELGLMHTSNQNGKISISVNGEDATGPLLVPATFVDVDTIAWRQWHHWNYVNPVATIGLRKGLQTITINTVGIGQMNYDFINFNLVK